MKLLGGVDPAETMNLADKPEHQSVIASLAKHLPPVAATASESKPNSKKSKTAQ